MNTSIYIFIEVSNLQIDHLNILELLIFLVERTPQETKKKSDDK